MIRQRCDVLRNASFIGGSLSRQYRRATAAQRLVVAKFHSTPLLRAEVQEPPHDKATPDPSAAATEQTKPKFKDPFNWRRVKLANWINENVVKPETKPSFRVLDEPGALHVEAESSAFKERGRRLQSSLEDKPAQNPSQNNEPTHKGTYRPKLKNVVDGIELKASSDFVAYVPSQDGTGFSRAVNTNRRQREKNKDGDENPDTEKRTRTFNELLDTYGKRKARIAPTPVIFESAEDGVTKTKEIVEHAEKATPVIDQTLRKNFLSLYSSVTPPITDDVSVDVDDFKNAIFNLPIKQPDLEELPDVSGLKELLPPKMFKLLSENRLVNVAIPEEVWSRLSATEMAIVLKHLTDHCVVRNHRVFMNAFKNDTVKIRRPLFDLLVIPNSSMGYTDHVKEIIALAMQEKIFYPRDYAHLLRSFRYDCRKDPSKLAEVNQVVQNIAKDGFEEGTYGYLMHLYGDVGRLDLVIALFNNHDKFISKNHPKTVFVYAAVLWAFSEAGMAEEAEYVFNAMRTHPDIPKPTPEIYGFVAQVYAKRKDYFPKLLALAMDSLKQGMEFHDMLFGSLLRGCVNAERLDVSMMLFNHLMMQPGLRPTKRLITDYLMALAEADVEASEEAGTVIGYPIYERLPVDEDGISRESHNAQRKATSNSSDISESMSVSEAEAAERTDLDSGVQFPYTGITPENAGELLAIADLQYQFLRKHWPFAVPSMNQKHFLNLMLKHKFYESMKKAYRWLSLASGFRGRRSIFPRVREAEEDLEREQFSGFSSMGSVRDSYIGQPEIQPHERYEFDYLHHPIDQFTMIPALRAAYETQDLDFARHVVGDFDRIRENHPELMGRYKKKRDEISVAIEAMAINTFAHCGDMDLAFQRFNFAMENAEFGMDAPRLWAKRLHVFLGQLAEQGDSIMQRQVFHALQRFEVEYEYTSQPAPWRNQ